MSKIFRSRWRVIAPLAATIVVFAVAVAIVTSLINWIQAGWFSSVARSTIETSPGSLLLTPFTWMSAALAVSVMFIATVMVSISAILHTLQSNNYRQTWLILFSLFIGTAAIAFFFGYVVGQNTLSFLGWPIKLIDSAFMGIKRPPITYFMDTLAIWELLMIVAAFCVLCMPFKIDNPTPDQIAQRSKYAVTLLYMGAITLTIGVIQFNFLFRLPGAAANLSLSVTEISVVADGLSMFAGTFFSLLLAAMFTPTALILSEEIRVLASQSGKDTAEEREAWLKNFGLSVPGFRHIAKLLAILAPFLTGWLGDTITKALSSI